MSKFIVTMSTASRGKMANFIVMIRIVSRGKVPNCDDEDCK